MHEIECDLKTISMIHGSEVILSGRKQGIEQSFATQDGLAFCGHDEAFGVREGVAGQDLNKEIDHFSVFITAILHERFFQLRRPREREIDDYVETPPHSRVKKVAMIGCCQQKGTGGPVINFLQQHCNQALELTYLRLVIPALCHGVKFIEQKNRRAGFGIVQNFADIAASST
ncbi:hypothetical protein [Streptomyces sp. S1D4-20]|uniref:hypothetical protein n=1 Tax=Streptomyces sp. S1D4-20 TaxID=2594462 RepID=UPI001F0838E3|nr:hypothetical protein [Streptomyces sp. S1D4-20]